MLSILSDAFTEHFWVVAAPICQSQNVGSWKIVENYLQQFFFIDFIFISSLSFHKYFFSFRDFHKLVGLRSDLTGFTSSFSALLSEGDWFLFPPKGGRFSSWAKPFLRVLGEGISSNSLTANRLKRRKILALKLPFVTRLLFAINYWWTQIYDLFYYRRI